VLLDIAAIDIQAHARSPKHGFHHSVQLLEQALAVGEKIFGVKFAMFFVGIDVQFSDLVERVFNLRFMLFKIIHGDAITYATMAKL